MCLYAAFCFSFWLVCSLTVEFTADFISAVVISTSESSYRFLFWVSCSCFSVACSFMNVVPFRTSLRILNMLTLRSHYNGALSLFSVVCPLPWCLVFISVLLTVLVLALGCARRGSRRSDSPAGTCTQGAGHLPWVSAPGGGLLSQPLNSAGCL